MRRSLPVVIPRPVVLPRPVVIPAKAGIQGFPSLGERRGAVAWKPWVPASAGMTEGNCGVLK